MLGSIATGDKHAEFHVAVEGVAGEVGAGHEHNVSVSDGALGMKTRMVGIVVREQRGRPGEELHAAAKGGEGMVRVGAAVEDKPDIDATGGR